MVIPLQQYPVATLRLAARSAGRYPMQLLPALRSELLTVDIEHEETQAGVRDPSDPAYPVLARSLRVRRDNIGATIATLENLRAPKADTLDTTEREVA